MSKSASWSALIGLFIIFSALIGACNAIALPSCSDTDTDQTNNCGPNDSQGAGTRNEEDRGSGRDL